MQHSQMLFRYITFLLALRPCSHHSFGTVTERNRNATGRPCSHPFHCARSFRNELTTSRCDRSGTVPELVRLALWCERTTGRVLVATRWPMCHNDKYSIHLTKECLSGEKSTYFDGHLDFGTRVETFGMWVEFGRNSKKNQFSDFRNSKIVIFT